MIYIIGLLFMLFVNPVYSNTAEGKFLIYLPEKKIPLENVYQCDIDLDISRIKLKKEPIINDCDLVSYSLSSHTMELKTAAWKRLMKIKRGTVFIVCVGKSPIYWGVIWSDLLSVSCKRITIVKPGELRLISNWKPDDYSIKIQCGYPTEEYFQGTDLRGDKRIIDALRKSGKLKE